MKLSPDELTEIGRRMRCGETLDQIAPDYDRTPSAIRASFARARISGTLPDMRGIRNSATIREQFEELPIAEALETAICLLEEILPLPDPATLVELRDRGFTPSEARLYHILAENTGQIISRERCMAAYMGARYNYDTTLQIISVKMVAVRRKLLPGERIDTIHGAGYRHMKENPDEI